MMVGLAVVLRWLELTNPLVPKRPRRAVGTFREGIWYWRGFRLPMPLPTEPAVGRELDCPKPRLRGEQRRTGEREAPSPTASPGCQGAASGGVCSQVDS